MLTRVFSASALERPLGRREYLTAGALLMAGKYAVDATAIYLVTGVTWTPADYLVPLLSLVAAKVSQFPVWLNFALLAWTAPFVWLGVSLSVRRAYSAGISPWWVVAFFVPVLNYIFILGLAVLPEAMPDQAGRRAGVLPGEMRVSSHASLLAAAAAGAVVGLVLLAIGVMALRSYGATVFLATPFVLGAVSGFVSRRLHAHARGRSVAAALSGTLLLCAMLVAVSFEGLVCILMAAPLAVPIVMLGASIGHHVADQGAPGAATLTMVLLLVPAGAALDASFDRPAERVVFSAIEIDAPADRVWSHVIAFDEITAGPPWYFRFGLAYPLRARIEGQGAGAIRYCEFTTGAFTEPITVWERPVRLAFDVASQPPPLQEWSPYSNVYAPHQQNYFRTTRGEFRLVELPGGRTRLEGRTWYTLRMNPAAYWSGIAEPIVHAIHGRVLRHIKERAERRPASVG